MTTPINVQYWMESCDIGPLGGAGGNVRMLTSAPAITTDIYCEQPYCSADGNRLVLLRHYRLGPDAGSELLVYDVARYRVGLLDRDVVGVANAAWSGVLFVTAGRGPAARLVRWDLNTLTREELFGWGDIPCAQLQSVSADQRYGVGGATIGRGKFGIVRVELPSGHWKLIYESPDICNPHLQCRLRSGARILVQENRGARFDDEGNMVAPCDERGVGLFSLAADGSDRRDFPVGPPLTPRTTGHECWIGDTDRVLVTVADFYEGGTLLEASHDHAKPRVVSTAPHRWNHISASRCGRYFVTDTYESRSTPIIVGSIRTGQWRVLCEPHTSGGGGQYTHLHPYLTGDNRWVVFNSDRTGLAQVYLAEIPGGFLEELG